MARGLSLIAGGAVPVDIRPAEVSFPAFAGEVARHGWDGGTPPPASLVPLPEKSRGGRWLLPSIPTLSELFAGHVRDAGWAGFLLPQVDRARPVLWVQERMAILESGRIYPPGLGLADLIHVEARDAKSALWAMEEGLKCNALSTVIGEIWGDPASLDFTATRRLAVAAERSGVACWLVRLNGSPNLSGARMRWRIASLPSLPHPFDPRASGPPAWDAELFRSRTSPPGRWSIAHDGAADAFHLLAEAGGGALEKIEQLRA